MNTDTQNVLLATLRDIADCAEHPKAVEGPALARIARVARAAIGTPRAKSINLAFILSMPGCSSWNGKWSGEGSLYAIIKSFGSKKAQAKAEIILAARHYGYNFGDGWRAAVEVKRVEGSELRDIRKRSKGFCGYDWMVDSILADGAIYGPTQPKPPLAGLPPLPKLEPLPPLDKIAPHPATRRIVVEDGAMFEESK
jgi:hypothetical protein